MDLITLALSKKFTSDAIEAIDEAKVDKTDIVQSDWNQNDETSLDYIKNRPFYEGEPEIHYNLPEITISDETSLSLGFTFLQGTLSIEDGKTYEVIINGNVYTAKCVQIDSSGFELGDKNLQEYPFYFLDRGIMYQAKYGVQEAPITIAIRTTANSIKKLERKFVDGIVGMDVEGKIFPYQDKNYIAGNGAEIFNSYLTNKALGQYSHAEGEMTNAIGFVSHAEGGGTVAYGMQSHAEGLGTEAYGNDSHAEGWCTIASGDWQHVQGKLNIEDTEDKYAHIVGNGENTYSEGTKRSNAHTLDWNGNAWYQGDIYVGSTSGTNKDEGSKKLATEEYVNTEVANLVNSAPETLDTLGELATALKENSDIVETLNSAITNKADKDHDHEGVYEEVGSIELAKAEIKEDINNIGGTIEVTSGEPTKENTVVTISPSSETTNIYTAEEVDAKFEQMSEEIVDTKNIGLSAVILTFEQGGLSTSDGSEVENEARIRSNIVKIIKDSKIKLHDSPYKFGVWQYKKDGSFITYRGLEKTDFIANEDMYIRVLMSHSDTTSNIDVTIADKLYTNLYAFNIGEMGYAVESIMAEIEKVEFDNWKTGYVATNQEVGEIVPLIRTGTLQWVYQVVKCVKGDKFIVSGYGGDSPKLWCFTDKTLIKLSGGNSSGEEIEAEEDGFLIVNSDIGNNYKLEKLCTGIVSNDETRQDVEKSMRDFNKYDKIVPPTMPEIRYCIESVPHNKTSQMTLDEIISGYDELVEAYPNYVTKTLLGNDTSETYPIYRYDFYPTVPRIEGSVKVLSHSYTKKDYPTIIMDACIHGAERPCAKAMLNLMTLIANANDNSILGWLRNNIHFVIIPVLNTWGYANDNRNNSNGVDLNRNFPVYWEFGDSTNENDRYKGESPLSEKEAEYLNDIFTEYENNAVCYYNWHTHGLFTGYDVMTSFNTSPLRDFDAMQNIGFDIIKSITASGWTNHNLPRDSGYIGMVQISERKGLVSHTATLHGIPSACPEVMYRYYDGGTSEVYNNDVDCMNVEYMLYAVANACKKFLF